MVKESAQGGEILNIEQDIVERVFELGDRKANALYTPKSDMIIFDTQDSWEDIRNKIKDGKHSAYPICENNNIDNILGIVIIKDLFLASNASDFKVSNYIKEPLYFNETTKAYQVLHQFKKTKNHYGIVIDEYGSVKGIITLNDLIDELVGDTTHDEEKNPEIKKNIGTLNRPIILLKKYITSCAHCPRNSGTSWSDMSPIWSAIDSERLPVRPVNMLSVTLRPVVAVLRRSPPWDKTGPPIFSASL